VFILISNQDIHWNNSQPEYCARSKSKNEITMEILKVMGIDRGTKKVPFMNKAFIFLSTNRWPRVAYHHIDTSKELVMITTMQ
jgi:hypothetical protein